METKSYPKQTLCHFFKNAFARQNKDNPLKENLICSLINFTIWKFFAKSLCRKHSNSKTNACWIQTSDFWTCSNIETEQNQRKNQFSEWHFDWFAWEAEETVMSSNDWIELKFRKKLLRNLEKTLTKAGQF